MGAISAFSTTNQTLKRNKVLFGAALAAMLVNLVPSIVLAAVPFPVAGLLSLPLAGLTLFATPFLMGGLLSMAEEGLDGVTRFETFVEGGKENYTTLLGTMILFTVVVAIILNFVTLGLGVIGVFVLGMGGSAMGGSVMPTGGNVAALAVLGIVWVLAVTLPMFFFQFYAPAIVVSDLGVVASLKHSAGVVRRNFLSTLGYSALAAVVGLVAGIAGSVVTVFSGFSGGFLVTQTSPDFGLGIVVLGGIFSLVISTVVSAFMATYQVAFYDDCLDALA